MKKLLVVPFLILFALAGCEEIVLVPEYIHDTLYLPDPCGCVRYDTIVLERIDTVEMRTVIIDQDTLLRVKTDSIFVTKTVTITEHDTVYVYQRDTLYLHIYHDTLVTFESGRALEQFDIYLDIAIEFSRLAMEYGWDSNRDGWYYGIGGNCIIEPWRADEAPPTNRSAYQYFVYDQWLVKLKESLTHDQAYTPLMREFARRQLGKPYDPEGSGTIMDPSLSPNILKFSDSDEKKRPFLDELFSHNPS